MICDLEKVQKLTVEQKLKLFESVFIIHEIFDMDPRDYYFDFRFIRK